MIYFFIADGRKICHIHQDIKSQTDIVFFVGNARRKFLESRGNPVHRFELLRLVGFPMVTGQQMPRMTAVCLIPQSPSAVHRLHIRVKTDGHRVVTGLVQQLLEHRLMALIKRIVNQNGHVFPHPLLDGQVKLLQTEPVEPVFLLLIVKAENIPVFFLNLVITDFYNLIISQIVKKSLGRAAFSGSRSASENNQSSGIGKFSFHRLHLELKGPVAHSLYVLRTDLSFHGAEGRHIESSRRRGNLRAFLHILSLQKCAEESAQRSVACAGGIH